MGEQAAVSRGGRGDVRLIAREIAGREQPSSHPIVVVLGAHCSGLTLCANVLSAFGVDMSDEEGPAAVGGWERREVARLHDRILEQFHGGRAWLHDFPLPTAWWSSPALQPLKREMREFLHKKMTGPLVGFKDPRTARLLPFWKQLFNELQLEPKYILCLRHPAQASRSVAENYNISYPTAEYRWLVYMTDALRSLRGADVCTVEYEDWFSDVRRNVSKLSDFLQVGFPSEISDPAEVVSEIVDSRLRHDNSAYAEVRQPLIRTFYQLAHNMTDQPSARDRAGEIAEHFWRYQRLQRDVREEHEAGIRRQTDGLEDQVLRLRHRLAQSDQESQERAASVEFHKTEAAKQRNLLAQAEQLAAERAEQLDALQGEIAQVRDVLARTEQESGERAASVEALRSENAAMREALGRAGQKSEERAASVDALQGEIAQVRDVLARTEQESRERAASVEALRSENAAMREALGRAGQKSEERAASVDALQGEIAQVRDVLARTERESCAHRALVDGLRARLAETAGNLIGARETARFAVSALKLVAEAKNAAPPAKGGWLSAIGLFSVRGSIVRGSRRSVGSQNQIAGRSRVESVKLAGRRQQSVGAEWCD